MVEETMLTQDLSKNDIVMGAYKMVQDMQDVERELRRTERLAQHAVWLAQGGCDRCGGRGWIVAWDTLDSLSGCYAEYGACPEGIKCTASTVGADPGYYDHKYDNLRGHKDTFVPSADLLQAQREVVEWQGTLRTAQAEARIEKGKTLRVVRGRKVAIGTVGQCIWLGGGFRGSDRVGIKDPQGVVHWLAASNCEVA